MAVMFPGKINKVPSAKLILELPYHWELWNPCTNNLSLYLQWKLEHSMLGTYIHWKCESTSHHSYYVCARAELSRSPNTWYSLHKLYRRKNCCPVRACGGRMLQTSPKTMSKGAICLGKDWMCKNCSQVPERRGDLREDLPDQYCHLHPVHSYHS